jgi:ribosomal protein S18 acetylase RimI-like enzyme
MHAWERGTPDGRASEVILRDARRGDEPDLGRLWRELMDLHVALDRRFALSDNADGAFLSYVDQAIERPDYCVRVAEVGGEPVGFIICCIQMNSPVYRTKWIGYVNDLCVTASMRGRGIGELLVEDAIHWLRENGAESVEVYVARRNDGAQRFWRRVGAREYLDRMSFELPED